MRAAVGGRGRGGRYGGGGGPAGMKRRRDDSWRDFPPKRHGDDMPSTLRVLMRSFVSRLSPQCTQFTYLYM